MAGTLGEATLDLTTDNRKLTQGLNRARDEAGKFVKTTSAKIRDLGGSMSRVGTALLPLSASVGLLGIASIKAASDFESSFAGVRKTVNATEEEFAALSQGFRDMAKEIPVNVNELNSIGEAAGQLGIKTENILSFTRTMADLGVTTNLSAEQAATSLAKLANITGLPQDQFDRLGSTIVALGNNFATTEADIVMFGTRMAGAGAIAGLAEAEILAIGAAMSSVGVEAEAGGTAVQKVLLGMTQAVAKGGEDLETFAATAGLSAEQFTAAWKDDAAGAFTAFVEGLGEQGDAAFDTLEALDLQDQRLIRSFLSLANAGDLLADAMTEGNKAFEENTALTKEAEQRYATFASQMTLLKNELHDAAITFGTAMLPAMRDAIAVIKPLISGLGTLAKWFGDMPAPIKLIVIAFGALVTAAAPVLFIAGQLVTSFGVLAGALGAGGLLAPALAGVVALLMGPVGITLAIGAVALAMTAFIAREGGAWENFWAGTKETLAEITGSILSNDDAVNQLADSFRGEFPQMISLISDARTENASFEETVRRLKIAFREGTEEGDALREMLARTEDALDSVNPPLVDFNENLDDTPPAAEEARTWINRFMATIAELNITLDDNAVGMIRSNELLIDFGDVALPSVVPPLKRVAEELDTSANSMVGFIGEIRTGNSTIDGFLGKIQSFIGMFSKLIGLFSGGAGKVGGFFGSIGKGLSGLFGGGGGGKGGVFGLPDLSGIGITAGGQIGTGMTGAISGLMSKLPDIVGKLMNFLPIIGPLLAAFGGPLLSGLKALGGKIFGVFKGIFKSVADIRSERQGGIFGAFTVPESVLAGLGRLSEGFSKAGRKLPDTIASLVGFDDVLKAVGIDSLPQFMFAMNKGDEAVGRLKEGLITGAEAADFFGGESLRIMKEAAIELGGTAVAEFENMIAKAVEAGVVIPAEFLAAMDSVTASTAAAASAVTTVTDTAVRQAGRIGDAFVNAGDVISDTFADMDFTIPVNFDVSDIKLGGGGGGKGSITPLAHGGIVTSPTLAMIGESGPEAVVPLGRGGSGAMTVNLDVDGERMATKVVKLTPAILRSLGLD